MMLKRIGANTLRYLLTLLVASLVIFIALRVIPGNPAEVALGVTATDESVAKLSATMGIDKPLWQQYVTWVQGLVTGNLGMSLTSGADISPLVFDRLQVVNHLGGVRHGHGPGVEHSPGGVGGKAGS